MDNAFAERAPMRLRRPARLLRLAGDERLVALVRAGDEGAFEALYDRHHPAILGFCRHMLGSREEAEDAVQQTFLSAFRDLVATDKPIELRPWLFAIARNRCVSLLRARRAHVAIELAEPATDGLAATVERREDLRELLADLARLPEDQRAALLLAELGALDHAGIATVLGCPREKVKALVFQARTSLAASREARATPCDEIRLELATASGAELRRGPLRRHLRACDGCRAFKAEVATQRRMFALALPVVPGIALKAGVLSGGGAAASSGGAASATAAAATAGASGGTLSVLGTVATAGAGKVAVSLAVAGAVATGGALVERLEPRAAAPPAASSPGIGGAPRLVPTPVLEWPRSGATEPSGQRETIDPSATSESRLAPAADAGGAPVAPRQPSSAQAPDGHAQGGDAPGSSHVPSHATPASPPQPVAPETSGRGGNATPQPPTLPPQAQGKGPGSAPPAWGRGPSDEGAAPAQPPGGGKPESGVAKGQPSAPPASIEQGAQPGASASRRSEPASPGGGPRFEPATRAGRASASGPPAGKPAPPGPPADKPAPAGPPAGKPAPSAPPAAGKPPTTGSPAPTPQPSAPSGSRGKTSGAQGPTGGARGGGR